MPKRVNITLADIAQWQNLQLAACNAAKAKRQRPSVVAFFADFDANIARIREAVLAGKLCDGSYRCFHITDPKPRLIHAASFEDRIIHHAIINKIAHRLEQSWVASSYACRREKGSHKAVLKAAELCRRSAFVIKLDVKSYFPQIDHAILLQLLARQLKPSDLFLLLNNLLSSFSGDAKGLPIGALTSQYFANHYLDGFQRWLNSHPMVQAELRYMDDTLIFCEDKQQAVAIARQAGLWLMENRSLTLKPAVIQRTTSGLTFCGFKVSRQGIAPGKRRKRLLRQRLKALLIKAENHDISPLDAQVQACQLASLQQPANNNRWLSEQLKNYTKGRTIEI